MKSKLGNLVATIGMMIILALTAVLVPTEVYADSTSNRTVWVSRTGDKYHYTPNCSNMHNPIEMTLSEALSKGRTPCKVCARGSSGGSDGALDPSWPFTDVREDTYHYEDIVWLKKSGVATGFQDGSFKPLDTVKRCDMAAFLYRIAGKPAFASTDVDWNRFSDVDTKTPHADAILWMASKSITTGFEDGTFRPYDTIKRCDMAAFLHRMAGDVDHSASQVSFKDVAAATPHAAHIRWLAAVGVSKGFDDGTYRPFDTVKRCDMAAFLHRMEGKVVI